MLRIFSRIHKTWPGLCEGLILHRNGLPEVTKEFLFGLRYVPKQWKNGFSRKFETLKLITLALIFRMPLLSANLLTATYVCRFRTEDTSLIGPVRLRFILCMLTGISYFMATII